MPPNVKSQDKISEGVWDHGTNVQGLVRNRKSGRYYARFRVRGKRTMKALKTKVWSVAKLRLADELAKIERQRRQKKRVSEAGDVRVGDLLLRLDACYDSTSLSDKTKTFHRTMIAILDDQWGVCFGTELRAQKPDKITNEVVSLFSNFLTTKAVQKVRNNGARSKRRGCPVLRSGECVGLAGRQLSEGGLIVCL